MARDNTPYSTPEASYGGPVYDAVIHPAGADIDASRADRLALDTHRHFFYDASAAAAVYSHFRERSPNPTALAIMGLADQARTIERAVQRKDDLPYPGVPLGHTPSVSRAPDTSPVMQPFAHFTHHAHQFETRRQSRARFGR